MEIKIIRKIDNLGRIVIPKDLRVMVRIALGDAVEITVKKNAVVIKKQRVRHIYSASPVMFYQPLPSAAPWLSLCVAARHSA